MSQATWEVTRFKAENDFEAVRNLAEMNKQAAMAVAMKLSMPSHLTAVRAAEKAYYLTLAVGAEATGVISSRSYRFAQPE
jgi:hypothetical protein